MPKVTVILTSYNHEKFIREAIDSVLNQTFTDFELIIWDDCSTDNSWEIISSYSDVRIKAYRSMTNQLYILNEAISEVASGEYIAIHHSDDVWELEKLEKQVRYLDNHSEIGAVFSRANIIGEEGDLFCKSDHFYFSIFDQPNRSRHQWLKYFFYNGNALCHPSVLIRKKCYEDCGLYLYGLKQIPDFDLWIRVCLKYEIYIFPKKLIRFRVRDNEANSSGATVENTIRERYERYKVLYNYRNIKNLNDFVKVFPEAKKYKLTTKSDFDYILAMLAMKGIDYPFGKLFALDILFNIITQPQRAKNVLKHHNFSYKEFHLLTSQHDHFSVQLDNQINEFKQTLMERDNQINEFKQTLMERDNQLVEINDVLNTILSSKSWRIIQIIRTIFIKFRSIKIF